MKQIHEKDPNSLFPDFVKNNNNLATQTNETIENKCEIIEYNNNDTQKTFSFASSPKTKKKRHPNKKTYYCI